MTGEQRLAIAFDLHALACNLAREGIRARFPNSSEEEVERRLRARIQLGRSLVPLRIDAPTDD